MNGLARKAGNEAGVIAIIVAITMTLFIGLLAYVVDIGYSFEMRRQLQSAADAAALAGMVEKIKDGSDAAVTDVAQHYADENDLVGLPDQLTMREPEITEDYVQVTVEKEVEYFFAPIFQLIDPAAPSKGLVLAHARARGVYVVGADELVPWGLGFLKVKAMTADVNDGPDAPITGGEDDDVWSGNLSIPTAQQREGYLVDLNIMNSQDYWETLEDVARIFVRAPEYSVQDVYLTENNKEPGESTYVRVVADEMPSITNQPFSSTSFYERFDLGADVYEAQITAPPITEHLESFGIDIRVGGDRYYNAAVLIVKTNRSPIQSIELDEKHWTDGGGTTGITVTMRRFDYGEQYTLKLAFGDEATAGNFSGLDFSDITHEDGTEEGMGGSGGADYRDNLADGFEGEVHINDTIATKTGNMVGPTRQALESRFICAMDWATWDVPEGEDRPDDCGRLVNIPVVEIAEPMNGKSYVIVIAIATFFIESDSGSTDNITGRFVEWARAGTYSDTMPDSDFIMKTVRLDKPE